MQITASCVFLRPLPSFAHPEPKYVSVAADPRWIAPSVAKESVKTLTTIASGFAEMF